MDYLEQMEQDRKEFTGMLEQMQADSKALVDNEIEIIKNGDGLILICKTCGKKRSFKEWGRALNTAVNTMYDDIYYNHDGMHKYPKSVRSLVRKIIYNTEI